MRKRKKKIQKPYSHGESSLHHTLKERYLDSLGGVYATSAAEVVVDGYRIDVVRDDELIEIQTRRFSAIKRKLCALIVAHPVRLVHPIAQEKWIVQTTAAGAQVSRKKSPKRGQVTHIFDELISFPELMAHPNLSLEIVLTREEEVWCDDGRGSWRRKGRSVRDHRLLEVVEHITFNQPKDFLALLPPDLPEPFTSRDLASALKRPVAFARRVTYCLRRMQVLQECGRQRRAILYCR